MSVRVPATEAQYEGRDFFTTFVGDPTEVFSFEKRIAVTRSDFFKTAVGGGGRWREGVSNWIRMPKDDAVMFRKYLHLLRTGTVATSHDTSIVENDDDPEFGDIPFLDNHGRNWNPSQELIGAVHAEYNALVELYVFCEKIMDVKSKHLLMTAMVEAVYQVRPNKTLWLPLAETVAIVFNGTTEDSPMRWYLVDLHVVHGVFGELPDGEEAYHPEFFSMATSSANIRRILTMDTARTESVDGYLEVNMCLSCH